jgi:hypothetical protein
MAGKIAEIYLMSLTISRIPDNPDRKKKNNSGLLEDFEGRVEGHLVMESASSFLEASLVLSSNL